MMLGVVGIDKYEGLIGGGRELFTTSSFFSREISVVRHIRGKNTSFEFGSVFEFNSEEHCGILQSVVKIRLYTEHEASVRVVVRRVMVPGDSSVLVNFFPSEAFFLVSGDRTVCETDLFSFSKKTTRVYSYLFMRDIHLSGKYTIDIVSDQDIEGSFICRYHTLESFFRCVSPYFESKIKCKCGEEVRGTWVQCHHFPSIVMDCYNCEAMHTSVYVANGINMKSNFMVVGETNSMFSSLGRCLIYQDRILFSRFINEEIDVYGFGHDALERLLVEKSKYNRNAGRFGPELDIKHFGYRLEARFKIKSCTGNTKDMISEVSFPDGMSKSSSLVSLYMECEERVSSVGNGVVINSSILGILKSVRVCLFRNHKIASYEGIDTAVSDINFFGFNMICYKVKI